MNDSTPLTLEKIRDKTINYLILKGYKSQQSEISLSDRLDRDLGINSNKLPELLSGLSEVFGIQPDIDEAIFLLANKRIKDLNCFLCNEVRNVNRGCKFTIEEITEITIKHICNTVHGLSPSEVTLNTKLFHKDGLGLKPEGLANLIEELGYIFCFNFNRDNAIPLLKNGTVKGLCYYLDHEMRSANNTASHNNLKV